MSIIFCSISFCVYSEATEREYLKRIEVKFDFVVNLKIEVNVQLFCEIFHLYFCTFYIAVVGMFGVL